MDRNNFHSHLNEIWVILNDWRRDNPERSGEDPVDRQWVRTCQAMHWIEEDLEAAYYAADRKE